MLLRTTLALTAIIAGAIALQQFSADTPVMLSSAEAASSTVNKAPALPTPVLASRLLLKPSPFGKPSLAHPQREIEPEKTEPDVKAVYSEDLKAKAGDTLSKMLTRAGVTPAEAHEAIKALTKHYNPRKIRAGQVITVTFRPTIEAGEKDEFLGLSLIPRYDREVVVEKSDNGFKAGEKERPLHKVMSSASETIESSLFKAGSRAGLPAPVLAELIRMYSWDVDFARQIQPGDSFKVMFEQYKDDKGKLIHNGKITYANLTLSGTAYPLYLFTGKDGFDDYFDDKGRSAKKALMRTPIDGARLSSGYGKRRHPVLGYTKMHRGVDFAAPRGTPIYAAGDGAIDYIGRKGGYGKYIRIRHNSEYSTAYAHMHGYAKGMKQGKRVRQGQVIGYVGTTGRSTGNHLHFEIMKNGRQTNPMRVRMPSGRKLKGKELKTFMAAKARTDEQFAALHPTPQSDQLADSSK